jgi:uncharacterized repeat protein (TIGR02543 family)
VTYDGNGNTGGSAPIDANTYEQGATVTLKTNTGNLVKTGFTFASWNTAADGKGTSYAGGAPLTMGAANVILYARWTQNPTFTVTYDGNGNTGGSAPIDVNAYEQGSTVTVKTNSGNLVKTGYKFAGWNTIAEGNGTSYAGEAALTMGAANITLYARWTQNPTFNVTYNGNGNTSGSVPIDLNAYEQGTAVTVNNNTENLKKQGFIFDGWNTSPLGTGTNYAVGGSFAMGGTNVTLYANWKTYNYVVTFNGQGATVEANPSSKIVSSPDSTIGQLPTPPKKAGYTFGGWFTQTAGAGTEFTASTSVTAPITVYAKWNEYSYTVTFDGQGATVEANPATKSVASPATTVGTLPDAPTKTGYTFGGWFSQTAGAGTEFTASTPVSAPITVHAKWTINSYTVTYDGNGNSSGTVPPTSTHQYGTMVTTADNTGALAKTGYVFMGWKTSKDETGTSYAAGTGFFTMGAENVTLYATWAIGTFTVTYDGNNYTSGTVPATSSHQYNTTVTVAANSGDLKRTGYLFGGWNTLSNGTGTNYPASTGTFTMVPENVKLFAKWDSYTYAITFDAQNATTPTKVDVTSPATTVAPFPTSPTKTGYDFGGWYTAINGGGTEFMANTIVSAPDTVFAKWTIKTFTVTYDGSGNSTGTVPATVTYQYNERVTVLSNTGNLVNNGYTMVGWTTGANGTGTFYLPGDTFRIKESNVILYAKWTTGMKKIIAATNPLTYFTMGQTPYAQPTHAVTLTQNYWMDSTEVTQTDFIKLMGFNPSNYKTATNLPVEQVTWFDAVLYCNERSKRDRLDTVYSYTSKTMLVSSCTGLAGLSINLTKNGYRLPTEAQWEYACRAGTTSDYYWGTAAINLYAWYSSNSGDATHPIATKIPNTFGLYDMCGNVPEWCNDWYGDYTNSTQMNPTGPTSGSTRVTRGGGWSTSATYIYSAIRSDADPGFAYAIGLRLVLPVQ